MGDGLWKRGARLAQWKSRTIGLGLLAAIAVSIPSFPVAAAPVKARSGNYLPAFSSDADLRKFLESRRRPPPPVAPPPPPPPAPPPSIATPVMAAPAPATASASPTSTASTSITNNQIQGVDEGDIVKLSGNHLIVLRRGRLFSIVLGKGGDMSSPALDAGDYTDANAPGVEAKMDWYDEMLVYQNWIAVIGYSYSRGGTEINRFKIDRRGEITFVDSYHLRSDDYYSSRNYATRMIDGRLILYTPQSIEWVDDPLEAMPAYRQWKSVDRDTPFKRIAPISRIYAAVPILRDADAYVDTVHGVTSCAIAAPVMQCKSAAVLGSEARTFFVSNNAVYVWTTDDRARDDDDDGEAPSYLYRIPFDLSAPQAVGVRGGPIDQFSFQPDVAANRMNILVRAETGGDKMWSSEVSGGDLALLRLPMSTFGDGTASAPAGAYAKLPRSAPYSWQLHNRFVGTRLLYGSELTERDQLTVVSVPDLRVSQLRVGHAIARIEPLGDDAIIIGERDNGLAFTSVALGGTVPTVADRFVLPQSSEGDSRSHGFFYKPLTSTEGLVGLPILSKTPDRKDTSSVVFVRNERLHLSSVGTLSASGTFDPASDFCQASCTDWYGNARPIFVDQRIIALMGYQLVEGKFEAGKVAETNRLDFSPAMNPPMIPIPCGGDRE